MKYKHNEESYIIDLFLPHAVMGFVTHVFTHPLGVVPTLSQISIMRLQSSVVLFSLVTFSGDTKITRLKHSIIQS